MTEAQIRRQFYASEMGDVRHLRLLQRLVELIAAGQMRRSGEFLMACILLAITLPLMFIVALAIRWESAGPVFERRERIGANGRRFQMLSFRTTTQRPGQLGSWQTTQVGQFLQSTRIEALPQLLNVLRGEMSLIDTSLFD
jgi:lipopolysaccharide/colanic/teichoic acid biosynthesis glycosyltransferase